MIASPSVIQSEKNLYPGINAHLNSHIQGKGGGWESFRASHTAHIALLLDQQLPENYYAALEKSLQIKPDAGV